MADVGVIVQGKETEAAALDATAPGSSRNEYFARAVEPDVFPVGALEADHGGADALQAGARLPVDGVEQLRQVDIGFGWHVLSEPRQNVYRMGAGPAFVQSVCVGLVAHLSACLLAGGGQVERPELTTCDGETFAAAPALSSKAGHIDWRRSFEKRMLTDEAARNLLSRPVLTPAHHQVLAGVEQAILPDGDAGKKLVEAYGLLRAQFILRREPVDQFTVALRRDDLADDKEADERRRIEARKALRVSDAIAVMLQFGDDGLHARVGAEVNRHPIGREDARGLPELPEATLDSLLLEYHGYYDYKPGA